VRAGRARQDADRMAADHDWLREGTSVAQQQQTIRDFGKSRAKALKDRKNKIPVRQRAGLPQFRKRGKSNPTMNYTRQAFTLRGRHLVLQPHFVIVGLFSSVVAGSGLVLVVSSPRGPGPGRSAGRGAGDQVCQ
jgi:hypothetical protein